MRCLGPAAWPLPVSERAHRFPPRLVAGLIRRRVALKVGIEFARLVCYKVGVEDQRLGSRRERPFRPAPRKDAATGEKMCGKDSG